MVLVILFGKKDTEVQKAVTDVHSDFPHILASVTSAALTI